MVRLSDILSKLSKEHNFDLDDIIKFESVYLNSERVSFADLSMERFLSLGDLVKVFPKPKRFGDIKLTAHSVLYEDSSCIAIDKPQGLPSLPVASNSKENCKHLLEQITNSSLWPVHRLDELTQGVLVFAKSPQIARRFQIDQKKKRIEKRYLAKIEQAVATGLYEHHITKGEGRMLISEVPTENSKPCRLEILDCKPDKDAFIAKILLETGRTHQIRAQLAHLRSPLCSDPIYNDKNSQQRFYLCAYQLNWLSDDFEHSFIATHIF
ncbi:MAG: RNA pseudouridine synthase [Bdellovibrionales bacterium]|nr:RNA pseudouridine synthase [Bdellovibrionales bacterium]